MGNQQERPLLSHDFVGGLITGEAWFGLTMQKAPRLKTKHGFTVRPRFALQMNDRETMTALFETFDEWRVPYYVVDHRAKVKSWNDSLRVEVAGMKRVKKLLEVTRPHIHGDKRRAADLVWEFILLRESKAQADPYGEEEFRIINHLRFVNGGSRGHKQLVESSETVRRTLTDLGAMIQSEPTRDRGSAAEMPAPTA